MERNSLAMEWRGTYVLSGLHIYLVKILMHSAYFRDLVLGFGGLALTASSSRIWGEDRLGESLSPV